MTFIPSDKIRLTTFLKNNFKGHVPIFWDGKAIIPFGSFDLVVTESDSDDPIWKWEGQIHYQQEKVYIVKGTSFSYDFMLSMTDAVEEVGYAYLGNWKDKLYEIIDYIENKHGVSLNQSSNISHETFRDVVSYAWVSGDWPEVKARVQIVTTEYSEPTITLDSVYLDNKYVYGVTLEDETTYKEVVDSFFKKLNASSS